ncbi:TPA: winged helix-turn-helix domain-containing protein [Enterobacter cancerogenus]|mgnify:FL=1|nr:winged helix-turn-helix domain-containing protein [Enterobacter cancerogenus]HDR2167903.1 winged helix-turn-helix domain-containing protein [Enterobacter cancerogenus]HDR2270560.1 winged helix-turn-helix domain-containing protein [Enterobacter cancerogenus]
MEYIINDLVVFDVQRGRLSLPEGDGEVFLAQAMTRLLKLFIEKNGQTIEREELFEKVWDDFGMRSSNANLNQHISLLRKEFALLGLPDNIIVTVPKIGFKFIADIAVRGKEVSAERKSYLGWLAAGALALSCCFAVYTAVTVSRETLPPIKKEYPLGTVNGCKVLSFNRVEAALIPEHLDMVRFLLQKLNLSCNADKEIRLSIDQHFASKHAQRVFFSLCQKEGSVECINLYTHNGEG